MKTLVLLCLLLAPVLAYGQGVVRRVDTIADLLRINPFSAATGQRVTYAVQQYATNLTQWSNQRLATWYFDRTYPTNRGNVFNSPYGGQFVFEDKFAAHQKTEWFGTVGNGVTDDSAAIQAALDASATYGSLEIGPGSYGIASTIYYPPTYKGSISGGSFNSTVINWVGETNGWCFTIGSGSNYFNGPIVERMTINGNHKGNGINCPLTTRGYVDNVHFRNIYGTGLRIYGIICGATRSRWSDFTSTNSIAVDFSGGSGNFFSECNFDSHSRGILPGSGQITIDGSTTFEGMVTAIEHPNANFQASIAYIGNYVESVDTPFKFGVDGTATAQGGTLTVIGSTFAAGGGAVPATGRSKVTAGGPTVWIGNQMAAGVDFGAGLSNLFLVGNFFPEWTPSTYTIATPHFVDFNSMGQGLTFHSPKQWFGVSSNIVFDNTGTFPLGTPNVIELTGTTIRFDNDTRIARAGPSKTWVTGSWGVGMQPDSGMTVGYADIGQTASQLNVYDDVTPMGVDIGGAIGFGGRYLSGTSSVTRYVVLSGRRDDSVSGSVAGHFDIWVRNNSGWINALRARSDGSVVISNLIWSHSHPEYEPVGSASNAIVAHTAASDPHGQYVLENGGVSTNQSLFGDVSLSLGSDLASGGSHRALVRDATTGYMKTMTGSYFKGWLDIHASDIVDSGSKGREVLQGATAAAIIDALTSGRSSSNYLRGDLSWATPPSGGTATNGITDAPNDGLSYGRKGLAWVALDIDDVAGFTTWGRAWADTVSSASGARSTMELTGGSPATIDSPAQHVSRANSSGSGTARHRNNFIGGTGISIGLVDDGVSDEADITVSLADGDRGDYSVSGGTATIDSGAVTYGKIQNVTAGKILGRTDASSGSVQELTPGSGLKVSGTNVVVDPSTFISGQILLVTADEISLTGTNLDDEAWHNLLGSAKTGLSKTIPSNTLASGTTLKIEASGTMAFDSGVQDSAIRIKIGSSFTLTFPFQEVDSIDSASGVWTLNAKIIVKTAGSAATVRTTGVWDYQTLDVLNPGQTSYYCYRTRATTATGLLDTTVSNDIALDFYGSDTAGGKQFNEMICESVIVTRL